MERSFGIDVEIQLHIRFNKSINCDNNKNLVSTFVWQAKVSNILFKIIEIGCKNKVAILFDEKWFYIDSKTSQVVICAKIAKDYFNQLADMFFEPTGCVVEVGNFKTQVIETLSARLSLLQNFLQEVLILSEIDSLELFISNEEFCPILVDIEETEKNEEFVWFNNYYDGMPIQNFAQEFEEYLVINKYNISNWLRFHFYNKR